MKKRGPTPRSRGREHAIDSLYDPPLYSSGVDKGYPSYGVQSTPLDYSPDCGMDYMTACKDLSPQSNLYPRVDSGLASSSSHNRSFELRDPPGGSRYLSDNAAVASDLNRSRSTESSRFNGSVLSGQDVTNRRSDWGTSRNIDTSKNDLNKSNLSYRERWDRSRRTAPQQNNVPLGRPPIIPGSYQPQFSYDSNPSVPSEKGIHENVLSCGKDTSSNRHISSQWETPDSSRKGILIDTSKSFDANRSTVLSDSHDRSIVAGSHDVMTPTTYRIIPLHEQNGSARPVHDGVHSQSGRSVHNTSHVNLSVQSTDKEVSWTDRGDNGSGIQPRLASLAVFSLLALVLALLAMQLIFSLLHQTGTPANAFLTNSSYMITHEVAVAMACVVVMLDLCCVLVCAMQGLYAAMLCNHGNPR